MPIIYKVTVTPAIKQGVFHITWHNVKTRKENSFERSADEITPEEVERLWQEPRFQLTIGQKLFRFLDGDTHHFQQALDESAQHGEPFQLHLRSCKQTADWPFELLAQDSSFLLPQRLHLIRWVSDWGAEKKTPPLERRLKLLFMACSALDVEPELDFEQEEESILQVTEGIAVEVEVEDSGSLEGLRDQLEQEQYDVVHLSGHAGIDPIGQPFFIMEDETGYHCKVFPDRLWREALIENPPRLLFLSGSSTGETANMAAASFSRLLVENYHVPAVLGWGRSVSDVQATHAEAMIYKELSRGKSILDAVHRARQELIKQFPSSPNPAWPLLRLYSSGEELNAIVKKGWRPQPRPRWLKHVYLKQSKVKVLTEGFVGRRRQLQQSLRALKRDFNKVGVLLHGTSGLGKSCLAGKISERFKDHTLIIVHGRLNAVTLEAALEDAFIVARDEKGKEILAAKKEMTEKLSDLCTSCFKEKNYLMLLDDFDQNLEGAEHGQPGPLLPEAKALLEVLLHFLPMSAKMTQLIITCRYLFSIWEHGYDLIRERLKSVTLISFQPAEQLKKARGLKHIFNYSNPSVVPQLVDAGRGNPRLMEWLDVLVGQMADAEVPQLLDAIRDKQEEFIRHHVIRELLLRAGKKLAHFLRLFSIFRRPVLLEGVQTVANKAKLEAWEKLLHQGLGLTLVEYDSARQSYSVTLLLRDDLLGELKDLKSSHEAAFTYYKKICEPAEHFDPILVEEWIFHALGCGEEDAASEQGGKLVKHLRDRLAFQESVRVGHWVLAEKKQKLSTEHDAFILNEIAVTTNDLGDYRKAINYYEQALTIDRELYGEEHPNVSIRMNNLGSAWADLGDYRKAIDYYRQALDIDQKFFSKDHPNVAIRLNNLGEAWRSLGDHRKAIGYFQQALTIDQAVFGKEHPNVARELNNLGLIWADLGDSHKAIDYYQQALSIRREVYGEKHPQVAIGLNNLGSAWDDLGEHRKAIEYFQQALTIDRAVFGEAHPNVAATLNNLGEAWRALGEHRKAIDYYQQALNIDRAVFGEEHPNVAATLNNLGEAWRDLGETQKAIDYLKKSLSINRKVFGEEHPEVATSLSNYGEALRALGQPKKAIANFDHALTIIQAVFGKEHPNVARELNNLGSAWLDLGDNNKAIGYYERALAIDRAAFGEEHPNVARELHNLGSTYFKLGKKEKAFNDLEKAYSINLKFFGPDHPSSKTTAEWLQKFPPKLIKIEIDGDSGLFVNKEKELRLKVFNRSELKINEINIELDSSSQYEVKNKKIKFKIKNLDSLENKILKAPIRVSVPGTIPLNLKLLDEYYKPTICIYSYEDNPYIYGPPITDINNFFGRKKDCTVIVNEICGETGPHRLVIGEQRSGKTSFLYYLKNSLHNPITPIYISLEKMPCPKEKNNDEIRAYSWLLDILIYELKKTKVLDGTRDYKTELKYGEYFARYLSEIITEIKQNIKGFRLCLLLDEGNRILKIREDFQLILRATLNELAKDFRMVLACSNEFLDYVQESKSSPLKNVFRYTYMKPLANRALKELITEPASRLGYRYEKDAINQLDQLSGGHPYYCQAICAESFNIASQRKVKSITNGIVSNAKKEIVNSDEVRDKFMMGYWNFIKDSNDDLLCLKAIIDQKSIDKKFNPNLEKLLNRQLIKELGNGKYSITSDLFKIWLIELLKKGING